MGETSYPVAGGGGVTDARYENLLGHLMGSGRVPTNPKLIAYNTPLVYADGSGRQVRIRASSAAIVRGFRWETDASGLVLPLEENKSGRLRIDMVVLRLDRGSSDSPSFTVRAEVIKGVPGDSVGGATVPSPVQQFGSSGVYDWPIATVRVASNVTAGQPLIQDADVARLDYFLAAPSSIGGGRTGMVLPGIGAWHTDAPLKRAYIQVDANEQILVGERGPLTRIGVSGGWEDDNVYCQRRNGFVFFQATLRYVASTRTPAEADIAVCTLPPEFCPTQDMYVTGFFTPGHALRARVDSMGAVRLSAFGANITTKSLVTLQPLSWPAR